METLIFFLLLYPMDYPQAHPNIKHVIFILGYELTNSFSPSFRSLSYDRSLVPSKLSYPQSAI